MPPNVLTKPDTVTKDTIGHYLTLPKNQFPDFRANASKDKAIQDKCINDGGTPDGLVCVFPPPPPPPPPVYVAPVVYAAPTDGYKAFIYAHESGNRTDAINPGSGACGLGQALPCSKMGCSLSDYACQDNFFTSYMLSRYGSWEQAYYFWVAHSWW